MDSNRPVQLIAPVGQLLLIFVCGVGASSAFAAGYWASVSVCVLLGLWASLHLILAGRRRYGLDHDEGRWEAAVLERERQARTLAAFLDHAPVPLLALGEGAPLSALNLAARKFFATDDVVVDPPMALLDAAHNGVPGERQTVTLDAEGSPRSYALTLADLMSDERLVRIVALVDVQAEIQAAEAAALRELIQVLSHEIMNSLTPVTSLAQTAADMLGKPKPTTADRAQAREAVESVARRSEGLLRFIGAYRELARLPAPHFAEVSVAALLGEVALLFRSRWGRKVQLVYDAPPDVSASMDRDLVSQALINVLANAAEAALEGAVKPTVRLSAERTRQGRLVITVADNGRGVNLPDPNVIFRPFFTTKREGTGVGLSLARQVVLAHGGEIAVAPPDGPGAAIVMSF